MRGRRSVRCGQTCEYRKARLILTHDPGEELFLGALHPAAALFREHIDIPELIAEHATYRKVLEEAGARVLTVRQILLDGTGADGKPADRTKLENLRRFAAGFLTFDTQNLSPETAEQQKEYRQSILAKTSPRDLVRIILRQPIIRLSETQINTGLKAEYSENPVMNLFYTRDQLITTAKGIVIGRMNSPQREKGCDILQFCLEKIGMKPLHRIEGRELIERWAKIHNLKQAAKSMNFLTENKIEYYSELESKIADIMTAHDAAAKAVKEVEQRMSDLSLLIKHTTTYRQLKPIYDEYRKSPDKEKYLRGHESEIILFEAAARALKEMQIKKLPDLAALRKEYRSLNDRKTKLYEDYRQAKKQMQEYGVVKKNVDSITLPVPKQGAGAGAIRRKTWGGKWNVKG